MATKVYAITMNPDGLGYEWYTGYDVVSDSTCQLSNTLSSPQYIGKNPTIYIDVGDDIYFTDYRSKGSFPQDFMDSAPTEDAVKEVYLLLLGREADSGGLAYYSNPANFSTMGGVIDVFIGSTEYKEYSFSVIDYPLHIESDGAVSVVESDDYEQYVDNHGDLSDFYNNSSNTWDYDLDGTADPVQSQSKSTYGASHYYRHGRGESRIFMKIKNIAKSIYLAKSSTNSSIVSYIGANSVVSLPASNSGPLSSNEMRLSINELIDINNDSTQLATFNSGWIDTDGTTSVGDGATLTLSHNLGSEDIVFCVYAAEDSAGSNMESQHWIFWHTNSPAGIQIKSVTSTDITLQLGAAGYSIDSSGGYTSKDWGTSAGQYSHIKIIILRSIVPFG